MRFFDVHTVSEDMAEHFTSERLFRNLRALPEGEIISDRMAVTIASWWHHPNEPYTTRLSTMGRLDRYATLDNFGTVEECETAEDRAALLALGRWIDDRKASAPSSVRSCECYTCFDLVVGTVGAVCAACEEWGCDPTDNLGECERPNGGDTYGPRHDAGYHGACITTRGYCD